MKPPITRELLFAYFAGQATTFQKQLIDDWARDARNKEEFYACLEAWENQQPQYLADPQKALERHRARLTGPDDKATNKDQTTQQLSFTAGRHWSLWLVAASTLIGLTVGVGWLFQDYLLYRTYTTAYGEVRHLTLSDGSEVTLNANSSLKEPRFDLGRADREVELVGEADFSVRHTVDHRRFVVKTDKGLDVVVLGTEFTVYNRKQDARVVLKTGKVQLNYREGKNQRQLTMQPGDLVTLDKKGHARCRPTARPENYAAWRNNRYVFEETSLQEIVRLFADNYGMTLVIPDPQLAQWTVSGSFTARSGQELLETLMDASSLTYIQSDNHILITQSENQPLP